MTPSRLLLEGRGAVITGAGSGVGRASALRFAEEGAQVLCLDIDGERAEETARQVEAAGGSALAHQADVAVEQDVADALARAEQSFGRLDVVFNNVGIPTPRPGLCLEDHTHEDFLRLVGTNLGGVFHGCKHAVRTFKAQGSGGVVLNTGSVAGTIAWGGSVYGATKGAVHQLTRAVAIEGAPFGIRANAICPAAMPFTGFLAAGGTVVPDDQLEGLATAVGQQHPLGRPILAEDCAEAAVYLCSDRSANVTGVLLPVDGGYVAR